MSATQTPPLCSWLALNIVAHRRVRFDLSTAPERVDHIYPNRRPCVPDERPRTAVECYVKLFLVKAWPRGRSPSHFRNLNNSHSHRTAIHAMPNFYFRLPSLSLLRPWSKRLDNEITAFPCLHHCVDPFGLVKAPVHCLSIRANVQTSLLSYSLMPALCQSKRPLSVEP
jgi:hypothetical protein